MAHFKDSIVWDSFCIYFMECNRKYKNVHNIWGLFVSSVKGYLGNDVFFLPVVEIV